jgi:hypothetical protein
LDRFLDANSSEEMTGITGFIGSVWRLKLNGELGDVSVISKQWKDIKKLLFRVCWKSFPWGRVWGFTDFQVVNYLIFREKVPEFPPRSLQWSALFEGKKSKSLI